MNESRHYRWVILVAACIGYGFGISPAYYSWGFFLPHLLDDLGLSRQEGGQVFGLFAFLMSSVGPLAAHSIARMGVRATMVGGSLIAAIGMAWLSQAQTAWDCYLSFSILGGVGIGIATIVPCQHLGVLWFRRHRAAALGLVLASGGLVGALSPHLGAWILSRGTWRDGWMWLAGISVAVAVLALAVVREGTDSQKAFPPPVDTNHDDGNGNASDNASDDASDDAGDNEPHWSGRQAAATRQFAGVVFIAVAALVPWLVVVSHGRLHLADLGIEPTVAAGLLSTLALMSVPGRLLAAAGDYAPPQVLLAVALAAEGLGVVALLAVTSAGPAYLAVSAIGLGFGASYALISVVLARFFGPSAFPQLSGIRLLVTAVFSAVAPGLAGTVADRTGGYGSALLGVAGLSLIGAVLAAALRRPHAASIGPVSTGPVSAAPVASAVEGD